MLAMSILLFVRHKLTLIMNIDWSIQVDPANGRVPH